MSMMRCDVCDHFVDTDDDVEGLWGVNNETPNDEDFICGACCDRLGLHDEPDQITSFTPLTDQEAEDYKEMMRVDTASIYAT